MKRPCITDGCTQLADGPRCQAHQQQADAVKNNRRRTLAPPGGAAATMRAATKQLAWVHCAHCHNYTHHSRIQIDHITALADGGSDTTDNVQPLCLNCHTKKTTAENKRRREGDTPHTRQPQPPR